MAVKLLIRFLSSFGMFVLAYTLLVNEQTDLLVSIIVLWYFVLDFEEYVLKLLEEK